MNGKRGRSGGASLLARTWYGADRAGVSADALARGCSVAEIGAASARVEAAWSNRRVV